MTEEIRARVENLDAACRPMTFAGPTTVRAVVPLSELPWNLSEGMVLTQPTFLDAALEGSGEVPKDGQAALVLSLRTETPALALGGDRFLVGRGIAYRVTRVDRSGTGMVVHGSMLGLVQVA